MTTQPEALRLADAIDPRNEGDLYWRDREAAAAELRRLHAENFALAAGQCMNVVGDEGGTPMCVKAQQLQAARERDNVSFKQLLAQRDALLEALKMMRDKYGEYACSVCDHADAAIKAVEENKHEHRPQNRRASVPV